MSLSLKEPVNPNYAATVVALSKFVELPNCDNVKAALIFGNSIIVSKSAQEGEIGLFFPVETALSTEFLSANNLYRKPEWGNADQSQKGFFEEHGRVKAVKFRGHKSEGFFIPLSSMSYLELKVHPIVGDIFDHIGDHEICRKYVSKHNPARLQQLRGRQPRLEDQIVENQFRFHYDTENLRRNVYKVNPEDWISISDKWHGTSVVIANLLVKRNLPWYEKLLKKIGVRVVEQEYGLAYSSRRVLKEVNGATKNNNHFYNEDIWGIVAKEVQEVIPKGYTIYGEIVGYTPDGGAIQKGYSYGCPVGGHRFLVYRVTSVNSDGLTVELSWQQMTEFCTKYGLEQVKELWVGQAKDLFTEIACYVHNRDSRDWPEMFLDLLQTKYTYDGMCPYNDQLVPAEGVVLRVDKLNQSEAFKLKNFKFLEWESKELDKGESDIETEQSEVEFG